MSGSFIAILTYTITIGRQAKTIACIFNIELDTILNVAQFVVVLIVRVVIVIARHILNQWFLEHITRELVEETLKKFIGSIEQVPPAFSACMVDGKRAYDLARKGEEVNLKAKTLVIDEIELLECELPVIKIRVVCSKGTYIRALARDIGEALNSGAHLIGLIRTRVGEVKLEDCMQVEGFAEWLEKQEIETINE